MKNNNQIINNLLISVSVIEPIQRIINNLTDNKFYLDENYAIFLKKELSDFTRLALKLLPEVQVKEFEVSAICSKKEFLSYFTILHNVFKNKLGSNDDNKIFIIN